MASYSLDDVRATCKRRDAWWTVLLVDPVAVRLAWLVANRTPITPNQLTLAAFALGTAAAGSFAQATPGWLAVGALLYHLGFVLDCMDGKIARLKGTGSPFGAWLDFMLDRVRDGVCAVALAGGQYAVTGQVAYLWLGFAIVALDMIRYLNGPQIGKARRAMRADLAAAQGESPDEIDPADEDRVLHESFDTRARGYRRIRAFLLRHRIRTHLISGIEFQMAAFVVGPLTGLIIPLTVTGGVFLLVFELVLVYKFWLSTRAVGGAARGTSTAEGPATAGEVVVSLDELLVPRPRASEEERVEESVEESVGEYAERR